MAPNSQVLHILLLLVGALPAGIGFTRPGNLETLATVPPGASLDVLVQAGRGAAPERLEARITSGRETEAVSLVLAVRIPGFRAYRLASPLRLSDTDPVRPGDGVLRARSGDTLVLTMGEADGRTAQVAIRNRANSVDTSRGSQ